MNSYNIKILPTAESDIYDIINYFKSLSVKTAIKYYDLFNDGILSLATMPERNPLCKDSELRKTSYRFLLVKEHYIFYTIKNETVIIHRVLYGKRLYKKLL